jgi:UTP--glucose-1-phosphate uridylyltransferase
MLKVRKAVIPAAGFGTRFLPQTKAMPKEMLPIVDKPIIQYLVEQLVAAGVEDIILVTGQNKRSIEDHFDAPTQDLIANLKLGGKPKEHLIEETNAIANLANFIYVRQRPLYGNGVPLLDVEHLIGNEPFIYTWSDDFVVSDPPCFQQMIEAYTQYYAPIICSMQVTDESDFKKYGFAGGRELRPGVIDVDVIAEKPGTRENSPSDLASCNGFVLTPDIFKYLHQAYEQVQEGEELYCNDALKLMLADNQRLIALAPGQSNWYDTGDKLSYMKTVVDFALERPDIGEDFREYLRRKVK